MPNISVIISSYNGLTKLRLTLAAYKNQTLRDFEVIVASDGSSDGTLEFIKENLNAYPYSLRCVWHQHQGYRLARIRNCAWRVARAHRVVITDQDIVPNADCLANYAKYKDQELAIAGYIGWIDESVHAAFTEEDISHITSFESFMSKPEMRNLQKYNSWILWGGNMSLTRHVLELTGGFDEDFKAWGGEDTDMGVRCARMKYAIRTLPEAKMFHLNHPPSNSLDRAGSQLFYTTKRHDQSIRRNHNADYSDVVVVE